MDTIREIIYLGVCLVLSGCNLTDYFKSISGSYQGTVLVKASGQITEAQVNTDISIDGQGNLEVTNKFLESNRAITFTLSPLRGNKLSLTVSEWGSESVILTGGSKDHCFSNGDEGSGTSTDGIVATFCQNGSDITADLTRNKGNDAITLTLSQGASQTPAPVETPRKYTVSELITRAMNQNFSSAIQFQAVVQAKLTTQTAYLNLIPHLSINSVLNLASVDLLGTLKAIGDIAPFLFPTRWIEAKADKYKTEAEFDAWILSKADATNIAHGLIYSVLRDEAILSAIADNEQFIVLVRDQVKQMEHTGLMQAGASDDIQSILDGLESGTLDLQTSLTQEKSALAQAAGFYQYSTITDVTSDPLPTVDSAPPIDSTSSSSMQATALSRSYELRQASALIQASSTSKVGRFFQWLDPSGDREGAFGVGLVTYVQIAWAQTQELIDKKAELQAELMHNLGSSVELSNQYLTSYKLARDDYDVQSRRITRHLQNLKTGVNFSMSDLTNSLQQKLQAQIKVLDAQYGYYITRANLDRLLLSGIYSKVPTDRGEPGWIVANPH